MAALQRHLGLAWVTESALPIQSSTEPIGEAHKLPQEARTELIRLVHLGHIHGLHRLLDRFIVEDPLMAANCARLRSFVNRCELEALLDDLTQENDAFEA